MRAGQLRTRIQIDQPISTQEQQYGQSKITSWTSFAEVWARVEALGGNEAEKAQRVVFQPGYRITIRYLPGLTTQMRIQHEGRVLPISSIAADDRKTEMVILAQGGA